MTFDVGLLSPVTAGHDDLVSDAAFLDALVVAEAALASSYADIGLAPRDDVRPIELEFEADRGKRSSHGIDPAALAAASVSGGNPVIPLVGLMRERIPTVSRAWVHRGATSQDIWDTAIMFVARGAVEQVRASLGNAVEWLTQLAEAHRDDVVAARTLTQHAVPTTMGLRATAWARALRRAEERLESLEFPAQLAGAGGTLASFVEITGSTDAARALAAAFAGRLGLNVPAAPWHVTRWPVTELGDALVQAIDAIGKLAADVTTLSRTEIAEVAPGAGSSSAMPQKRNPAEAVLLRSAALRAPQLGATLHLASAFAVDERPDGAWHAEWPTLRELLRLALGASWHVSALAARLRVDSAAAARNLAGTRGLIVAERLSIVLGPVLGADGVEAIVAAVTAGADLGDSIRRALDAHGRAGLEIDVDALIDPAGYTGAAGALVDDAVRALRARGGGAPVTTPTVAFTAPIGPSASSGTGGARSGTDRSSAGDPRPLVVLGPSLGTSTILWEDVVPALAADYRVVAWDLPGHGASVAADEPFTTGELADAVAAGVRELAADRVLYAGVSLGGAVGLELCLRHPELVVAAAIVASGAKLGDPEAWHERAAHVRAQSTSSLIVPSAQRWFAPDSVARRPQLTGRLLHALQDADDESYALCCEALADYDVRGELGRIAMPTLVVWGEHDAVAPAAKAAEIADGVVDGRVVEIADAAHLPPAEQPEATASVLKEFFATVLGQTQRQEAGA